MSKQYNTCPYCGAHLDPGERCDCPRASPGGGKKHAFKMYRTDNTAPDLDAVQTECV